MAVKLFAAIVIGSMETEMRIYELNPRKGMKELDCIRTRLALGADAYSYRELDPAKVKELCLVLKEFKGIMDGYQVDGYRACATSAFRELRSSVIMRDHIEIQTGLRIHIISNSEQRFLDYKSIASESDYFEKIIANGTAIVDIGGNSMQISVFDKDKLITTQNIKVGKVSTRDHYYSSARNERHYQSMIREIMEHELNGFARLYQKERPIQNLIICDADLLEIAQRRMDLFAADKEQKDADVFHISAEKFRSLYSRMLDMRADEVSAYFGITSDAAEVAAQSMVYINCLLDRMGADVLWLMDVSICDGMCYDFGVSNKLLRQTHNFDEDIVAAARNIAKRYKCNQAHVRYTEEVSVEIFNRMKKVHGMKNRDRLLLQIAAILHNCGKYISLSNVSECAYNIIMATEIIGLTHQERKIIANVVRYNTAQFNYYDEAEHTYELSREEYLLIAKLTAILRVANALDRSHLQKCKGAAVSLKDDKLVISVQTQEDLSLEKITLRDRADFFEEVFNVHPEIHQKKR